MNRRDFLFLTYQGFGTDEWAYRAQLLEQFGYREASFPVSGATAEVFTRGDRELFVRRDQLDGGPLLRTKLIDWMRRRLSERRHIEGSSRLGSAVVARVYSDGSIKE